MHFWTVPKASLLPAAILSLLVVFTYSTLQNYGPESTLRKFHTSLHNISVSQANDKKIPMSDWNLMRTTLIENIGTPESGGDEYAMNLIRRVWLQLRAGATYSLARMERHPNEVRIVVLYTLPKQPPTPMVWVVDKIDGTHEWKISARKTLSALSVP
ncbi:MAG: hypothetical protein JST12_05485 [Armatimonadetes bacterium]|nr:hypothetical protein [Armatimonadota bacterium]MBS1701091.1 hypothetical protein [Armatimonadota bacterium]MBS1727892.1 hypothetical protein [Armatimonadota bacterium]